MTPREATNRKRAILQELTREECGCGCPTCTDLLGGDLLKHDGLPPWYWPGPSPCRSGVSAILVAPGGDGPLAVAS
jgi:hypothetical protein